MSGNTTGECWACGLESNHVEMHHIRGKAVDATWTIPLCRTCHDLVDRKPLNEWPISLYLSAMQEVCALPESRLMMLKFLALASRAEARNDAEREAQPR